MLPGAFPDSLRQALRAALGSDELCLVSAGDGSGVKTPSELCVSFLTPIASSGYVHSCCG